MSNPSTEPPVTYTLAADQLIIDAGPLGKILVDLPPRGTQGMRGAQPDFPSVIDELMRNQAAWGERAGITEADFAAFVTASDNIDQIDKLLPRVAKLLEVLTESRAYYENERQHLVLTVADAVDRRSRKYPELLALYDQTRKYRSASALKGIRTRRRDAAAANNGTGTLTPPAEASPAPVSPASA